MRLWENWIYIATFCWIVHSIPHSTFYSIFYSIPIFLHVYYIPKFMSKAFGWMRRCQLGKCFCSLFSTLANFGFASGDQISHAWVFGKDSHLQSGQECFNTCNTNNISIGNHMASSESVPNSMRIDVILNQHTQLLYRKPRVLSSSIVYWSAGSSSSTVQPS